MSINNSQRAWFAPELSTSVGTAAFTQIGTTGLLFNPLVIIFDNQSVNSVAISIDGVTTWRTFPAGEALTLDLRANHGIAPNLSIDIGTVFYGKASALGSAFSISYIYALNT
jgi:hypothetical protein